MPVYVQFENRATKKLDKIAFIDDALCAYKGFIPDPELAHQYDSVCWPIIGLLMSEGGYDLDQFGEQAIPKLGAALHKVAHGNQEEFLSRKLAGFIHRTWRVTAYR